MPAPPLSLRGIYESLRPPTLTDWVFSAKAYFAASMALLAGFSQNLENPYWAVLTIYIVLNPPETGAIRSKALFRLIGTVGGGTLMLAITGLFGDQLGILAVATIAVVCTATFLRQIDRTPTNYMWFSGGVTAGVVGLTNLMQPVNMFDYATARMGEISVGILAITAADSLFWPRAMTPDFLKTLAGWRRDARHWVVEALDVAGPRPFDDAWRLEVRQGLRDLAKAVGTIDAKAVQLPFDIVRVAPRIRQLNLVRRQVVELIADLTAMLFWARSLHEDTELAAHIGTAMTAFRAWAHQEPDLAGADTAARVETTEALAAELEAVYARLDPVADRTALVERGLLLSMSTFLRAWADLSGALHAIETGTSLSPALDRLARRAKPVRSIDYLGAFYDVAPMILSTSFTLALWYFTAWQSGAGALLFSFIGCVFLTGQGQILRSGAGLMAIILTAFATVFAYQFAVLPRVTDFPVLIAVLGCAMLPFGLLMTMSLAGMLVCVYLFAFLGLQSTYAGDFETSLQTLSSAVTGLFIALTSLYVCAYGRAGFTAHRVLAAVRRDIYDIARARRTPTRQRFLFLAVDRLALFFPAAEQISGGRLPHLRLLDDFAVGFNLLRLRAEERQVSGQVRETLLALRRAAAVAYRRRLTGEGDDAVALRARVDAALDDPAIWAEPGQDRLLHALTGLHLALLHPDPPPEALPHGA